MRGGACRRCYRNGDCQEESGEGRKMNRGGIGIGMKGIGAGGMLPGQAISQLVMLLVL